MSDNADSLRVFTFEFPFSESDSVHHIGFFFQVEAIVVTLGDKTIPETLYSLEVSKGLFSLSPELRDEWARFQHESLLESMESKSYDDTLSSKSILLTLRLHIHAIGYQPPVFTESLPQLLIPDSVAMDKRYRNYTASESATQLRSKTTIRQSGSITRGFTLGTNQDPYLNSALDLQLSGYLTEELQLQATLTDQNLPFQADGATQTLNEFDRVHIALRSPFAQIEMGDVDLSLANGTFGVLKRRVQGASANWLAGNERTMGVSTGLSVQRGTFHSILIQPLIGVRGPYSLEGAYNEPFITIVSGSERVYLNGELLTRGVNQDYTIDYGLAEIVFTGDRFMTPEDDIQVEYQYLNREYSRTLFTASSSASELLSGRMKLSATYLREADQNESARTDLLRISGDIEEGTRVSGADSVGYSQDSDYIRYTRIDTLIQGESIPIYRHIPGSSTNAWRVRFSEVGQGNGSYQRAIEAENGLIYQWVGQGRGAYEPLVPLQAPRSHQLMVLHSQTALNPSLTFHAEWAVSDVDLNRFSDLDDQDNVDHALRFRMVTDSLRLGSVDLDLGWTTQHSGSRFEAFERIRDTEFNTFWGSNLDLRKSGQKEWFNQLNMAARFQNNWQISALGEGILLGEYNGLRAQSRLTLGNFGTIEIANSTLESAGADRRFERKIHEGSLQYPIPLYRADSDKGNNFNDHASVSGGREAFAIRVTPMVSWMHEILDDRTISTDFIDPASMDLIHFTPGIKLTIRDLELSGSYGWKEIKRGYEGILRDESNSTILEAGFTWKPVDRSFSTQTTLGVLQQSVEPEFDTANQQSRRFRMKSSSRYGHEERGVSGFLTLQIFSEQKPLFQEAFVFTGPEVGSFIWEDLNGDGVQQVDEFFTEIVEGEGVYSQQFIPSNSFEPVTDMQAQWQQRFELFHTERNQEWNIEWFSNLSLTETSNRRDPADLYRLKISAFQNPESTLNGRIRVLQELVASQGNGYGSRFSARAEITQSMQKRGLGVEDRNEFGFFTFGEWKPGNRTRFSHEIGYTGINIVHDRLINRNLDIRGWLTSHLLQTMWSRSYQTLFRFTIESKKDFLESVNQEITPKAFRTVLRLEQRFFVFRTVEGQADVEWRNALLKGVSSTYSQYELTAGTGQGNSWVWSVRAEAKLNQTMRGGLRVSGRSGFSGAIRQTAEITVRALF